MSKITRNSPAPFDHSPHVADSPQAGGLLVIDDAPAAPNPVTPASVRFDRHAAVREALLALWAQDYRRYYMSQNFGDPWIRAEIDIAEEQYIELENAAWLAVQAITRDDEFQTSVKVDDKRFVILPFSRDRLDEREKYADEIIILVGDRDWISV
jgi:hypothetical protein